MSPEQFNRINNDIIHLRIRAYTVWRFLKLGGIAAPQFLDRISDSGVGEENATKTAIGSQTTCSLILSSDINPL